MLRRIAISCLLTAATLPAVANTRPHYGGTLRVEVEGDPWQRPDGLARQLVLEGLTAKGIDGSARPALATEWKPENDNHRWQFKLRPGVHFHDGTPVNSANVIASLARRTARHKVKFYLTGASPAVRRALLVAGVRPPLATYRESIDNAMQEARAV